jgi:hypothetical protein
LESTSLKKMTTKRNQAPSAMAVGSGKIRGRLAILTTAPVAAHAQQCVRRSAWRGTESRRPATDVQQGLLWLFVWLIRLIVSLIRQRRGTIARLGLRHALRYWGVEPAALLLCGVLAISGVLFYPRFWLCRASLDAYVADVVAGRVQPHGNETPRHWVGLFRVSEVELQPGGVVRMITTPVFLDDAGLTYSPVSAPPRIGEDSYRHITGAWYRWHRSW